MADMGLHPYPRNTGRIYWLLPALLAKRTCAMGEKGMMDEHCVVPIAAAELAYLQRDAARYRWIREQKHMDIAACWFLPTEPPFNAPSTPSEIDAAIDAAMQANK
jgi:hypothetical protein